MAPGDRPQRPHRPFGRRRERREPDATRDLGARFHTAWADGDPDTATPELLPMRLARAVVEVLPVAAAGISLFDGRFRVPLGASDETASAAERLQFTHGAGPCLDAGTTTTAMRVDLDEITEHWPAFAADLVGQTPYRAIISLPLQIGLSVNGAIDLYFFAAHEMDRLRLTDALTVVSQVSRALIEARAVPVPAQVEPDDLRPAWLSGPASRGRTQVWIAMGLVMSAGGADASDVLALLRSYAYSHDTVVDDLARDLLEGRIRADQLLD